MSNIKNLENDKMLNAETELKETEDNCLPEKRKRIYNTSTGIYYAIRQRSSEKGKVGAIKGKWQPPKKRTGTKPYRPKSRRSK